ncbi:hypothetical protein HK103_002859 [Boothiomyces macroporosus]|uniref:Uncharacterized protein n=1 Tax=Boothiomyces macroporosus TaxID=261099 RepID=A0AAD5UIP8_9FUNG|nr:hypothetical protein HK103_002859 [Boothiomyces macroporosus]
MNNIAKVCGSQIVYPPFTATQLASQSGLIYDLSCIKTEDGKSYCLAQEISDISALLPGNSLKNLNQVNPGAFFSNSTLICTSCTKKQLSLLNLASLPDQLSTQISNVISSVSSMCNFNIPKGNGLSLKPPFVLAVLIMMLI